jgi:hypothetical protein
LRHEHGDYRWAPVQPTNLRDTTVKWAWC